MQRIFSGLVALATLGALAMVALAISTLWATNQSRERTACYRASASVDACGTPSAVERALAHYVAHVDL